MDLSLCKDCQYSCCGKPNSLSDWCDECIYDWECDHPQESKKDEYEFKVPQERQKTNYMTTEQTVNTLFKLL